MTDDEEERHERKMIWLARGIIFLAVAWFFAMFAYGLWLTECGMLGWVAFAMFGPVLFALIYAPLDLILAYAIAHWLDV